MIDLSRVPEYPVDDATRSPGRPLPELLADLLPLRGGRLRQLASAVSENIDREIREGGASPRDVTIRPLVVQKHLRGLRDALSCSGSFAPEPTPAALLAVRYSDRGAFEAYGRIHVRLSGAPRPPAEARTLQEMLLALRLRMLCFDWASVAIIFGAQARPRDEVTLRKRYSRLAELAMADAATAGDWRQIDAYLKAKRRSFGGTPRRVPLGLAIVVFGVLGLIAWWRLARPSVKTSGSAGDQAPPMARNAPDLETAPRPQQRPAPSVARASDDANGPRRMQDSSVQRAPSLSAGELARSLVNDLQNLAQDNPIEQATSDRIMERLDATFAIDLIADELMGERTADFTDEQKERFRSNFRAIVRFGAFFDAGTYFRRNEIAYGVTENRPDGLSVTPLHLTGADVTDTTVALVWNHRSGQPRVVDVLLDGGSLVADYRQQVARLIDKRGVNGLLTELEARRRKAEQERHH